MHNPEDEKIALEALPPAIDLNAGTLADLLAEPACAHCAGKIKQYEELTELHDE